MATPRQGAGNAPAGRCGLLAGIVEPPRGGGGPPMLSTGA
nr:MAG TPA: hypothetical protein [Caudoviricetes sp.]